MGILRSLHRESREHRPRLTLPRTKLEYSLEVLSALGVVFGLYGLVAAYPTLPASIPVHFNFKGEVDSWSGKETIWFLGAGIIVLYGALTMVSRIPHLYNYPWDITEENAPRQYRLGRTFLTLLKTEIVWLLATIIVETVEVALGRSHLMQPASMIWFLAIITASVIGYFVLSYRAR